MLCFPPAAKRTDFVLGNDMAQDNTQVVEGVWLSLEGCQCRKAKIIRNHVAWAILVWVRLKLVANETKQTVYRLLFK